MTRTITVVHDPGDFQLASFRDRDGNPMQIRETEARLERIAEGLRGCAQVRWATAGAETGAVQELIGAVHAPEYLTFLRDHSARADEVLDARWAAPGVLPDTPVTHGAYAAAVRASSCAAAAATRLLRGDHYTYALCRPPGHHAGHAFMGGYCYLNNAVVAALALRRVGMRVGVVDVDFHHGNGTADILAREPDIPFVCLHASTLHAFPYHATTPSVSHQWFVPFDAPPSAHEYLGQLRAALAQVASQDALVISLGYDLVAGDPHGGWTLPPSFFGQLADCIAALNRPLCIVQEGGYALEQLPLCAQHFAEGLR